MKSGFLIFFYCLILFIPGCKPGQVIVEKEVKKTEYRDRILRDSIYQHDSIFIFHKGDTVFMYKYKYKYLNRLLRDTIRITDSIYIERPIPVETVKVVYKTNQWQAWRLRIFNILALLAIGYLALKFKKPIWLVIKKLFRLP